MQKKFRFTIFIKRLLANILRKLFLGSLILFSIGPLIWIVMSSFKSNKEILESAFLMPVKIGWEGYKAAFDLSPIFEFYGNSIFIAVLSTILNIFVVSMAAYILARFQFMGKNFITLLLASSLLIPVSSLLMPIYRIMTKVGLYDTKTSLIIVYAALGLPTSLFVLKSYIQGIPKELEESAYLEGASFSKAYFAIIFPIAKSGIAASAILQFLTSWNEFMFALVLTKSNSARTLPLALSYFTSQFSFNYTAMFAALTMVILPSIIIFTILQEQITGSMVEGSVKG